MQSLLNIGAFSGMLLHHSTTFRSTQKPLGRFNNPQEPPFAAMIQYLTRYYIHSIITLRISYSNAAPGALRPGALKIAEGT